MSTKYEIPTFLKWAGGKRNIIPQLEKHFPKKINRYHEPFLGGGSVFFYVKQKYKPKTCYISDINKDLINTFLYVRDAPKQLLRHLRVFQRNNSDTFYYEIRDAFNSSQIRQIRRAAAFIYLNKFGYNGLYRVNALNKFNVPYGNRSGIEIINKESLNLASMLLQNVTIRHQSFESSKGAIKKGDFVYLDPCYDPLKKTSFTKYTPSKFSIEDRENLEKYIREISKKGATVLLSNNDIPEIRTLYADFKINVIEAYRSIGSQGSYRGKFQELLISN